MAGNVLGRGYAAGIGPWTIGLSLAALPGREAGRTKHWTDPHRNRRKKRHPSMLTAELLEEGKHLMTVCNACPLLRRVLRGSGNRWRRALFSRKGTSTIFRTSATTAASATIHASIPPPHLFNIQSTKDSCEIAGVQL